MSPLRQSERPHLPHRCQPALGRRAGGCEAFERIEAFYWLHLARRDLIRQGPGRDGTTPATFTIRSPVRPNPIGTSIVTVIERDGPTLTVRGFDRVDGTPLIDLKPDRSEFAR
jgi:tRNA (Thr-GGU) A37 N-methylase